LIAKLEFYGNAHSRMNETRQPRAATGAGRH